MIIIRLYRSVHRCVLKRQGTIRVKKNDEQRSIPAIAVSRRERFGRETKITTLINPILRQRGAKDVYRVIGKGAV